MGGKERRGELDSFPFSLLTRTHQHPQILRTMASSSPLTLVSSDISRLLTHKQNDKQFSLLALLPSSSSSPSPSFVPISPSQPARAPDTAPTTPEDALRLVKDLLQVSGEAKVAEGKVDKLGEMVDAVRGSLEEVQSGLREGMDGWGMKVEARGKGDLA